ncbi:MAG: hypothetical protein ABI166_07845 [Mucilaginibacter sp.]
MKEIFDKITNYVAFAHLWHKLESKHSDEELNHLMLSMTEIEEDILTHYGLPCTFAFSDIFQELGANEDFTFTDINICLAKIELEAKLYFSEPILTDLELLRKAQIEQIEIDEILPELSLKLKAEPYYIYCYYNHLLKYNTTEELFLNELRLVVENNCSMPILNLAENKKSNFKKDKSYQELSRIGLNFLESFLKDHSSFDYKQMKIATSFKDDLYL